MLSRGAAHTELSAPQRDGCAVLSPHGAFADPTASADVLPRESIELRTIAFHSA